MVIVTNLHRAQSDGGVERSVFQATRELVGRGHRVNLIYAQGGDLVVGFKDRHSCATRPWNCSVTHPLA